MPALLEAPKAQGCGNADSGTTPVSLDGLVTAMGKRFQAEYIQGAIPYLRRNEPTLWAQLEALDQEETLEALLAYERLFFEGLHRYLCFLEAQRLAA